MFKYLKQHFIKVMTNEKGFAITGAIIAGAAIAAAGVGAAAIIGSQGAKEAAETQAEAQQKAIDMQQAELDKKRAEGVKAVALKQESLDKFKLPGILETPEGQDIQAKLKLRSEGIGVGYSPEVLKADTAATAAQTRAGLKQETIPAITAAASARGLGRSTIPVSQIGTATQAAERDIESRIAQLTVASEGQRSTDIQNAITQRTALAESQVRTKQAEAGTRLTGEFSIADTGLEIADSNFKDVGYIGQLITQQGSASAAYQLQQAAIFAGAIQSGTSAIGNSVANAGIIDAIMAQKNQNNAMVNIAPTQTGQYRLLPPSL